MSERPSRPSVSLVGLCVRCFPQPLVSEDRVNGSLLPLRALRRAAHIQGPPDEQFNGLTRGDVYALVEALRLARFLAVPWVVDAADRGDQIAETDLGKLREAFDRFDFEGLRGE